MYRLLEVGEVIEKGDEIWSDKKGWFSAELSIGENVPTWAAPMRRLVNPAVTPAALPDPGEGWRLLSDGETIQKDDQITTIRKGDEIQMTKQGKWEPVSSSSGTKVGDNHSDGRLYFFRRPIRLQSPGWRYLDAGETIRAGDEWVQNGYAWQCIAGVGDKVEDETETASVKIRRKLPANQGG